VKRIIVTVGPAILNDDGIGLEDCQTHIYRINGAHGSISDVEKWIKKIRSSFSDPDILIDLPGNKIRTANLKKPISLETQSSFSLKSHEVTYKGFHKLVKHGDIVLAEDSTLRFTVDTANEDETTFISQSKGFLKNNKGLHVKGINNNLPFFFPRDHELIKIANKNKVKFVGLSFVRNVDDVNSARKLINKEIDIIAKVETKAAVDNLNYILKEVSFVLIDRGDLSTDVKLEKVPRYQRFIVESCLFHNKRVFLATQCLKNMVNYPTPTIAEVIDLYNSFKMGIFGVQLSEETAIGKYPNACLKIIKQVIKEIEEEQIDLEK
tara:strand:+ start:414 stop:1379 length:966 start_codon:yes stop_codon:yes gene_type:complete